MWKRETSGMSQGVLPLFCFPFCSIESVEVSVAAGFFNRLE